MADKKKKSRAKPAEVVAKNRQAANAKNIAKRAKSDKLLTDAQGLSYIRSRHKYKFSAIKEVPINEISLNPQIFQGRETPYAEETVAKIEREGFDKSQDPIIVWQDDNEKKYVISGHSRFEGAKRCAKKDKALKTIPVKFFNGDKDDAIDYALIESNRAAKAEGVESDIKAYIRAKQRGYNKEFLRSIFKSDSYISILRLLAALNPRGRFVEILRKGGEIAKKGEGGENETKSFPYILRNATWVGQLRLMYENLTDAHEEEMFRFFYSSESKGLRIKKDAFFNLIKKKVEKYDFDPNKSLHLSKENDFEMIKKTDPSLIRYNAMRSALDSAGNEMYKKIENAARAKFAGDDSRSKDLLKVASDLANAMHTKFFEFVKFESALKKEDKRLQSSGMF